MKVLVTGGAGYIGTHTCVELIEAGHEPIVIDNLRNSNPKSLERVREITGKAVPFKNVLMLNVMIRWAEDNYHVFTDMTGEGTGYYACNGKYVPIKWYRETADDPFTYTYEDGTPLYLAPGKTYVGMLHKNGPAIVVE